MADSIEIIVNASAGSGHTRPWADQLIEKFRTGGLKVHVTLAQSGKELTEAAERAIAAQPRAVIAGGGDGTINAVGSMLAHTDIAFGVLPLGTLNHFAKDMKIPLVLDEAIGNIIAGHSVAVDVGEVNGRIFLNNSSLGIYPDIVRDREKQQQRLGRGKWAAFFWACISALRRYPFLDVRLTAGDLERRLRSPFIFIGNNEYAMEGFNIGSRSCMNGARLSLYVAQHTGRLGLLRLAASALLARLQQERDFDMITTKEIQIASRRKRLRVATDGEVTVMATPLLYRIHPCALRVIVPKMDGSAL